MSSRVLGTSGDLTVLLDGPLVCLHDELEPPRIFRTDTLRRRCFLLRPVSRGFRDVGRYSPTSSTTKGTVFSHPGPYESTGSFLDIGNGTLVPRILGPCGKGRLGMVPTDGPTRVPSPPWLKGSNRVDSPDPRRRGIVSTTNWGYLFSCFSDRVRVKESWPRVVGPHISTLNTGLEVVSSSRVTILCLLSHCTQTHHHTLDPREGNHSSLTPATPNYQEQRGGPSGYQVLRTSPNH